MPVTSADKMSYARVDFELGRLFAPGCREAANASYCFGSQQDKDRFQNLAVVKEITDADYCPMS